MNKKRVLFLQKLYETTEGNMNCFVNMWEMGEDLDFDRKETELVTEFLKAKGLIKYMTIGGGISITIDGIDKVETYTNDCDSQKGNIPHNNSVTNNFYGSIQNNQLQQNSNNSTQIQNNLESLNENQIKQLDDLLKTIKDNIKHINGLSSEHVALINKKVQNIQQCKKSNRLLKKGLKESLSTIRNVLEGVTGSIIASGVIHELGLFESNL